MQIAVVVALEILLANLASTGNKSVYMQNLRSGTELIGRNRVRLDIISPIQSEYLVGNLQALGLKVFFALTWGNLPQ